jgi:hypothetical protein
MNLLKFTSNQLMKNSPTTRFADITKLAAIFFIALFTLAGCGKTTDDSHVRLINATPTFRR